MTLTEIKKEVTEGKKVFWKNSGYQVVKQNEKFFIKNGASMTGLTWLDGVTMDYNESDFFIG